MARVGKGYWVVLLMASAAMAVASVKQDADLAELIWSVPEVIAFASRSMALAPGDLIYTGTPAGVGPIKRGQTVTGGIDGLGEIALAILP